LVDGMGGADTVITRVLRDDPGGHPVGDMADDPSPVESGQKRVRPIAAIIGGDIDRVEPQNAVMGDPFQNERSFVLERGDQDMTGEHGNKLRTGTA
jgi:hypothetical protein